jgi:hypothetical protein
VTSKSPRIPCALGRLSLTEMLRERQREANATGDLGFPERQPNKAIQELSIPGDIPLQLWSLNERTVAVI